MTFLIFYLLASVCGWGLWSYLRYSREPGASPQRIWGMTLLFSFCACVAWPALLADLTFALPCPQAYPTAFLLIPIPLNIFSLCRNRPSKK